jgi:DNA-binding response OmpR family regulator
VHALVIEDQFLIATLIEAELAELGYSSCDIVDTEAAAIEAARVRPPDIITADDRLTSGTGVSAVQAICAGQIIPVVFIVGDPENLTLPVRHASVIGKPFGGSRLREAVGEAIVRTQFQEQEVPVASR